MSSTGRKDHYADSAQTHYAPGCRSDLGRNVYWYIVSEVDRDLVEGLLDLDFFVGLDDVTDHDVVVAFDVQTAVLTHILHLIYWNT